jgi:hypothetical protein
MVVLIKKLKYFLNIFKKDLISSYYDITDIPSLSDLRVQYKGYNYYKVVYTFCIHKIAYIAIVDNS